MRDVPVEARYFPKGGTSVDADAAAIAVEREREPEDF